jgi:hypothetical protein
VPSPESGVQTAPSVIVLRTPALYAQVKRAHDEAESVARVPCVAGAAATLRSAKSGRVKTTGGRTSDDANQF